VVRSGCQADAAAAFLLPDEPVDEELDADDPDDAAEPDDDEDVESAFLPLDDPPSAEGAGLEAFSEEFSDFEPLSPPGATGPPRESVR
jgi:hypothetical protein